jgi:transposase
MDKKNDLELGATEASAPPTCAPYAGDGGVEAGQGKRLSAKKKLAAVQRLMGGENLDATSRDLNVPVHRLSEWRDRVLASAESALKERDARDDEIARLQAKVGEITMDCFAAIGDPQTCSEIPWRLANRHSQ